VWGSRSTRHVPRGRRGWLLIGVGGGCVDCSSRLSVRDRAPESRRGALLYTAPSGRRAGALILRKPDALRLALGRRDGRRRAHGARAATPRGSGPARAHGGIVAACCALSYAFTRCSPAWRAALRLAKVLFLELVGGVVALLIFCRCGRTRRTAVGRRWRGLLGSPPVGARANFLFFSRVQRIEAAPRRRATSSGRGRLLALTLFAALDRARLARPADGGGRWPPYLNEAADRASEREFTPTEPAAAARRRTAAAKSDGREVERHQLSAPRRTHHVHVRQRRYAETRTEWDSGSRVRVLRQVRIVVASAPGVPLSAHALRGSAS